MVSSKSSVPSSAKYDDWMGISRCEAATRAFTVSRPSVGGQSMTIDSYLLRTTSSRSFNRKWASISPTSRASSLANAMRAGAIDRFATEEGTMTSSSRESGSAITSYTVRVTWRMSRNDIVLFACGSRSTRSVWRPRRARAAARLMAVVVLPTPPFWFAIATIMRVAGHLTPAIPFVDRISDRLHLVFAQVVRVEALQPLLKPLRARPLGRGLDGGSALENVFLDEDGGTGPQRKGDRIARTRVDGDRLAADGEVNQR